MSLSSIRAAFGLAVLVAPMGPALAAPTETAEPNDRARIETVLRDYLLTHPEIVLEAEARARDNAKRQTLETHRKALELPYAKGAIGPADATVTVVEFLDYNCHFCRDTAPEIERLLAADPRVRLVVRQFPILSELSTQAARVALLVAERGDFATYHRALYAAPQVTTAVVIKAAVAAGITAAAARAAATDPKRDKEFADNGALAEAIGATGTPTFVIGDQIYGGAMHQAALAAALEKARKRPGGPALASLGGGQ